MSEGDNVLAKMQPWQLCSYILACCTIIRTDEVIYTLASTEQRGKHDHQVSLLLDD